jgi:tellurite resistance protein TerC
MAFLFGVGVVIFGSTPVTVLEVSTPASLTVIIVILLITTAASVPAARGRAQNSMAGAS